MNSIVATILISPMWASLSLRAIWLPAWWLWDVTGIPDFRPSKPDLNPEQMNTDLDLVSCQKRRKTHDRTEGQFPQPQ